MFIFQKFFYSFLANILSNRVITDHHKEARFPFLDEKLTSFLNNIPLKYKCQYELERGIGEKLVLRCCAYLLGELNDVYKYYPIHKCDI